MKMYDVNGVIKCGHRLFNLQKFIIAHDEAEAIAIFKACRPNAKMVRANYRHEVHSCHYKGQWAEDVFTQIKNNNT